jgi:hypothetical protein
VKPEPLRIRVLDALEDGPQTVAQVSAKVGHSIEVTRMTINVLIDDLQVEQVDRLQCGSGGPTKVYAIRGSVLNRHPLNAREGLCLSYKGEKGGAA